MGFRSGHGHENCDEKPNHADANGCSLQVVPTSLSLATHGWEVETVCEERGRTNDLRHATAACCEGEEIKEWQAASWKRNPLAEQIMVFLAEDLLNRGQVIEYRNGRRIKRGTLKLVLVRLLYTDGSAKHVGTPRAAGASAVVQYHE